MKRVAVVGSGPTGTSCVRALLERGYDVTMIDVGERLDGTRQAAVDRLNAAPRQEWSAADIATVSSNATVRSETIPFKLAFGSDYIYGAARTHSRQVNVGAIPTYALGGFSTVWGGAMLPAADIDLRGWPIDRARLEPHFRAVLAHVPLAGGRGDALTHEFPPYADVTDLPAPPQGAALLHDLARASAKLDNMGVKASRARLAVHAFANVHSRGCVHCGLCLSGCPTGAIYSTVPEVEDWVRAGRIVYHGDRVVQEVRDDGRGATVAFKSSSGSQRGTETYDAVFLAAGPVSSTRVLLQSLSMWDKTVSLLDSQKFLVPILRRRADRSAMRADGNVLASAFVEMLDPAVSPHWVHCQISPMSRLLLDKAGAMGAAVLGPILTRTLICWGSLHSDHSGRIDVTLRRESGEGVLSVVPREERQTGAVVRRAVAKLGRVARAIDSFVPPFSARLGAIGRSAHVGGSFPMALQPGANHTDLLGRPAGLQRVYVVDATTFPSVPGTTVALTAMANAHRIGMEAPLG